MDVVQAGMLSCVRLFATLRTVACQAPLSMEFYRQEYWSGLPFPSLGDLFDLGIEPGSPALAGGVFTAQLPRKFIKSSYRGTSLMAQWVKNLPAMQET